MASKLEGFFFSSLLAFSDAEIKLLEIYIDVESIASCT